MEIKMQKKNEEGKIIIKLVPQDLSAFYKNAGWDFVTKEKQVPETEGRLLSNKKEQ